MPHLQNLHIEQDFIPYHATTELPRGNVLILAPHPDDEVFGCAGAIMQHVAQGDSITVLLATQGDAAQAHDDDSAKQSYIQARLQESRDAAKILGYVDLLQWEYADRHLNCDDALVQRLYNLMCEQHIQQLYAPSLHEIHPDHYALAQAAYLAVRHHYTQTPEQALSLIMYEVGVPLHPNRLLDITPYRSRKQAAMQCFSSQLSLQNYAQQIDALNQYRAYSLPETVQVAEAYYALDAEALYREPERRYGLTRQSAELQRANVKICQL